MEENKMSKTQKSVFPFQRMAAEYITDSLYFQMCLGDTRKWLSSQSGKQGHLCLRASREITEHWM